MRGFPRLEPWLGSGALQGDAISIHCSAGPQRTAARVTTQRTVILNHALIDPWQTSAPIART
jgi:hypothetical protein